MRRGASLILICVLAGVLTNVAVGWGCAVFMDPRLREADERVGGSLLGAGYWNWRIWRHRAPGALRVMSQWGDKPMPKGAQTEVDVTPDDRLIPGWALFASPHYEPPSDAHHFCVVQARGWPLLALAGGTHMAIKLPRTRDSEGESQLVWAIALDRDRLNDPEKHCELRLLPLRPLWFGFAANTIFYAAMLWLVLSAPLAARRLVGARRGHATAADAAPAKSSVASGSQVQ